MGVIVPRASRDISLLMVVDSLQVGGAERHVAGVAAALHRNGYAVTVACSAGGMLSPALDADGVPVRVLTGDPVKRRVSALYGLKLRALVRESRFDLIHAHLYASAVASALATLGTSVPLVVSQHSEAIWRDPFARLVSRWMYWRADRVIAVSDGIRDLLISRDGVAPERIEVIPNAVTPRDRTSGNRTELLPEWRAGPVVGMVARLQPEKGVGVLLEAAPALLTRCPDCHVLVVGDGPLRDEMEGRVAALGLQDRVHFLGFRTDASGLIDELDLLVLPSLTEGTPLVVLEAMAAGVPVVASDVGGVPEQIRHGREGLLVPPGSASALSEACVALLRDPVRARQMGESGRRASSRFDHGAMVRRIEAVYGEVLETVAEPVESGRSAALQID